MDSVVQVRTHILTSDFGSSTRGERHNTYYADHTIWPHQRAAHLAKFKISVGRDPKNPTTSSMVKIQISTHLRRSGPQKINRRCNGRKLNSSTQWPNPRLLDFNSQFPNDSKNLFLAWRYPHSSPISCLGVYYENDDCHILCTRA